MGDAVLPGQRPTGELVTRPTRDLAPDEGGDVQELLADDLLRLRQESGGPRLSLFLPLSPGSPRSTKTRIRAKNLLNRAEKALRSDGLPSAKVTDLMSRVRRALDRARPMNDNHRGLAVFADADDVRTYDVSTRVPELAAVGDRFALTPLLPAISLQGRFFLLTLTQDRIRLFEGTALTWEPVDLEGRELAAWTTMPPPRAPQVHAFLADRGGRGTRTVFHGVESPSDERAARAQQHFRGVDRALREVLGADRPPLVLAGVRALQALYRSVSSYPNLLGGGIDGNPELVGTDELHRQAWAVAEPELRRGAATAVARYRGLQGTGRTLSDPEDVGRAAADGRVDTLLVAESACTWAAGDGRAVLRLDSAAPAEEHVESAVVATLGGGGAVFVVPDADLPELSSTAAILRY
jgi:hypothetical protein